MKIKLIFIGKEEKGGVQEAIDFYTRKIKFYTSFESTAISYLKNSKSLSFEEIKIKEQELILKKIEENEKIILLDGKGKELTSEQFSIFLSREMNLGTKNLTFIIGGAYGFAPALYQRANATIALSKMTFPHILARLVFLEQLYRGFSILKGEPYHHP